MEMKDVNVEKSINFKANQERGRTRREKQYHQAYIRGAILGFCTPPVLIGLMLLIAVIEAM